MSRYETFELSDEKIKTKLDVFSEDLEQEDKDKIEVVYDEIIDRVWEFEETIETEQDLNRRLIQLVDEYLNLDDEQPDWSAGHYTPGE